MGAPTIATDRLAAFCRRWKINELSLFGSAVRDDFKDESDVDVLVAFEAGVVWDFDDYDAMRQELVTIFGRPVDIALKRALRNPFLRHAILSTKRVLYAA